MSIVSRRMSRSIAAFAIVSHAFDVGVSSSFDAGTPTCSAGELWEELESDMVTLMQKVHTISKAVAKESAGERLQFQRASPASPSFPKVAAIPELGEEEEEEVALFQDPGLVEVAVEHSAERAGAVAAVAAVSAAAEASGATAAELMAEREEAMAEEVGERLGAEFAAEMARAPMAERDQAAPVPSAEPTSKKPLPVAMMQESRASLERVRRAAADSLLRAAAEVASANPAGMVVSVVGAVVLLGCVFMSLAAGDGGALRFRRQSTARFSAQDGDGAASPKGLADLRGGSSFRESSATNDSMVPRSVDALPDEIIQPRRGYGSQFTQNQSPRIVEPPPFYADPPRQESGQSLQAAPVFREGAPNTLHAHEVLSPHRSQRPWHQQSSGSLPPASSDSLPALCPLLVLPACESHFAVPFDMLRISSAPFEFDIVGLSLTPLLHTCVKPTGNGGRFLEISMVKHYSWNGNAPHATVIPAPEGSCASPAFEILGHARQLFGTLQLAEAGAQSRYVLSRQGQLVLTIHKDVEGHRIRVLNANDAPVCAVERVDSFGGAEHLQFRVPPGVDSVLVLSCVIATFVLTR